jgi:hypothetical protein
MRSILYQMGMGGSVFWARCTGCLARSKSTCSHVVLLQALQRPAAEQIVI